MNLRACFIILLTTSANLLAGGPLSKAFVTPISLSGNDIVFDLTRNAFYMSVPSSAGFPYGNSVVTIDPASGLATHITFIGSEPNKLAISFDGSRVYVGVDGAYSFCWWEPATDTVGPLVGFTKTAFSGSSVARDFAVSPSDPHTVVVSKADVSSTAAGDIEVFRDASSLVDLNLVYGAGSISFSDATTLIGFGNYTTGFDLWKWNFNGTNLVQQADMRSVISGFAVRIKAVNGIVYSDDGKKVSASTMSVLGTFSGLPSAPVVEPNSATNAVRFLGEDNVGGNLQLVAFDNNTFLKIDSKTFTNRYSMGTRSVVAGGTNSSGDPRLGFIMSGGSAGIITIPPPTFVVENFQTTGAITQLTWSSKLGHQYALQWSSDLKVWTTFITLTAAQYDTTRTFNRQGTDPAREFYRVIEY